MENDREDVFEKIATRSRVVKEHASPLIDGRELPDGTERNYDKSMSRKKWSRTLESKRRSKIVVESPDRDFG